MRILQVVPAVAPGSGVEAVAYHLEREWTRLGHDCERIVAGAFGGSRGVLGRIRAELRVIGFSFRGTQQARRRLRVAPPIDVTICHNDALVGDVYVNHGILLEAMRSRGHPWLRMVRNPGHLFVWLRDVFRFALPVHRVVVSLTATEDAVLRRTYPRVTAEGRVIGNGVDTDRFRPDPLVRRGARSRLGYAEDHRVALFVGHEFARKGLPLALEGLAECPGWHLLVVGGTSDMIAEARSSEAGRAVADRVTYMGRADPLEFYRAADALVLPSAYEAYPLVVLEALACGVPVIATPVGSVPDLIRDGVNGFVIERDPQSLALALDDLAGLDPAALAAAARATAESQSWPRVAQQYLDLFAELSDRRDG